MLPVEQNTQENTENNVQCTRTSEFKPYQLCSDEQDMAYTMLAGLSGYGQDKNIIRVNIYKVCANAGQALFFKLRSQN